MEQRSPEDILRQYWHYPSFRGIQKDIITSVLNRQDTLGLMPTGGGKSVTFQVPALIMEGTTLVITPLIALMKDQVTRLRDMGIQASAIYSGMTHDEILKTLENAVLGGVKLLYISPERIATDLFRAKLKHMKVSLITVDEAHCISQWGYDFRPSYLRISEIRTLLPNTPVLALTATATPDVVDDIQKQLGFERPNVFKMSFERSNLAYVVRQAPDKRTELLHILKSVEGCAIVYARSRRKTREVSDLLNQNGISATFYHAGLNPTIKDMRQTDWQEDRVRVMVATNAFGMGIDKADVRTVIHVDCPDSLEAYFQEAGRAGRDGRHAYAVLLFNSADVRLLHQRIGETFPEKEFILDVYDHLAYFYQIGVGSGRGVTRQFDIDRFCRNFHHFPIPVNSALMILQRCGYIRYEPSPDNSARLRFTLNRDQLYRMDTDNPTDNAVITTLLRLYCGLFVDYCPVDLTLLSQKSGLPSNQIYESLKSLTRQRIVDFIPRTTTPYITYLTRRELREHITIPKEVYEVRKEQYAKRIESVIHYATNHDECRSKMLLSYFGEKRADSCGQCDVCIDNNRTASEEERMTNEARKAILSLISDGKQHHVEELQNLPNPSDAIDKALRQMIAEEEIYTKGSWIFIN